MGLCIPHCNWEVGGLAVQGLEPGTWEPRGTPMLCFSGGRKIWVRGQNLDVVQMPRIRVTVAPGVLGQGRRRHVVTETPCASEASCGSQQV